MRADEWRLVWVLLTVLAVNTLVFDVAEVVSTAGFVAAAGPEQLLWLWPVDMVATIVAATAYASIADRVRRLRLVTGLLAGLAAIYLLIALLFVLGAPPSPTYSLVYLVADQQLTVFPLAVWALANDACEPAVGRRLFPVIASGTAAGSVVGSLLAAGLGVGLRHGRLDPGELLGLASVLFLVAAAVLYAGFRGRSPQVRQTREAAGVRETVKVGLDHFLNVPSMRYLAPTLLVGQLGMTIVEYRFLSILYTASSDSVGAMMTFLGLFKLVLIVATLLCQWLLVGRLIAAVEVKRGFVGLPAAVAVGAGLAIAAGGVAGTAAARFLTRLVEWSWDEPIRKMFQGLLPDERRGRIAAFMDTYFYAGGTVLGCVVLSAALLPAGRPGWISADQATWIVLSLAVVCGGVAAWSALRVRQFYAQSLLDWRFSRTRRSRVLDRLDL